MILIILFVMVGLFLTAGLMIQSDDAISLPMGTMVALIIAVFGIALAREITENKKSIPPIEVYRGNTELQITYIDSIPQDSIVVLKKRN